MLKMNLNPSETDEINGVHVTYGRIPVGLVQGFKGIIFYFQTNDAFDTELHENTVKLALNLLIQDSYDHGTYWELTKIEAVVWNELSQITIVSFRVRDSY